MTLAENPATVSATTRALWAAPLAAFVFVAVLALAAIAVRNGWVADDALRLWEGASTAARGGVPFGRIVAAYPTLPFLTTTFVAWLAPASAPVPSLVAAALFAIIAAFSFLSLRKAGFRAALAGIMALFLAFHPAFLRALIAGPEDMFLAAFLLIFCLSLYDLRARSGASEVMHVGLALMALAFSHPMGAAFAFAAMPFLAFAVRPVLVAKSGLNVVIALLFPMLFAIGAFVYVAWIFPGDGWTFFAAPAASLSLWTVAISNIFGGGFSRIPAIDASLAMGAAIAVGAPAAPVMLALAYRRRPLVTPAAVFVAAAIAATAISVSSGLFGAPTAIVVAAPVLAAAVMLRVPIARQRPNLAVGLVIAGWLGGFVSLAIVDPTTVNRLYAADGSGRDGERLDALAAGGATIGRDGVLADVDNAPAFVLGRGDTRGILGPQSESFALAMLFRRIDSDVVAVPDPQSTTGANDRIDTAFPLLFQYGLPGYRVVYQNNTWRIFVRGKGNPQSGN